MHAAKRQGCSKLYRGNFEDAARHHETISTKAFVIFIMISRCYKFNFLLLPNAANGT